MWMREDFNVKSPLHTKQLNIRWETQKDVKWIKNEIYIGYGCSFFFITVSLLFYACITNGNFSPERLSFISFNFRITIFNLLTSNRLPFRIERPKTVSTWTDVDEHNEEQKQELYINTLHIYNTIDNFRLDFNMRTSPATVAHSS